MGWHHELAAGDHLLLLQHGGRCKDTLFALRRFAPPRKLKTKPNHRTLVMQGGDITNNQVQRAKSQEVYIYIDRFSEHALYATGTEKGRPS